jgi:hypothetical protein
VLVVVVPAAHLLEGVRQGLERLAGGPFVLMDA